MSALWQVKGITNYCPKDVGIHDAHANLYLLVPHAESTGQLLASQGHVTEYAKYAGWEHGAIPYVLRRENTAREC